MRLKSMRGGCGRWMLVTLALAVVIIALGLAGLALGEACASPVPHPSASHVRGVHSGIRSMARVYGYKDGSRDSNALLCTADPESTDNPTCVYGTHHGLFQGSRSWTLKISKNTSEAIKYMRHRYGSPYKAWLFRLKHGWY